MHRRIESRVGDADAEETGSFGIAETLREIGDVESVRGYVVCEWEAKVNNKDLVDNMVSIHSYEQGRTNQLNNLHNNNHSNHLYYVVRIL